MRPASIILVFLIIMAGSLLSCSGRQTAIPPESTSPVSSQSPIQVTSSPEITSQQPMTSSDPATASKSKTETTAPSLPATTQSINTTPATMASSSSNFKVVGYITHWHLNKLPGIQLKGLTHLIWQGIEVTSGTDPTLVVATDAGWWQISDVVAAGHADGIKVLASLIGEWGQTDLNNIWKSGSLRTQLINNLVEMVKSYDLDGIDVDNENNNCDMSIYSTFVKDLYEAISPLGKIISIAGNPFDVCVSSDVFSDIDFVNVMTYDMAVPAHSTYDDSTRAIELWASSGISKDKLLIGIPFYGRDGDGTAYEYWWIVNKYKPAPNQNEVVEPKASGGIIWWNGPDLAKEKVQYMKDNGYGGVMMYELGEDSQDSSSLLQSVYDAVNLSDALTAFDSSNYTRKIP